MSNIKIFNLLGIRHTGEVLYSDDKRFYCYEDIIVDLHNKKSIQLTELTPTNLLSKQLGLDLEYIIVYVENDFDSELCNGQDGIRYGAYNRLVFKLDDFEIEINEHPNGQKYYIHYNDSYNKNIKPTTIRFVCYKWEENIWIKEIIFDLYSEKINYKKYLFLILLFPSYI